MTIGKQEFIQTDPNNFQEAQNRCPWAKEILKVVGGFLCFQYKKDALEFKGLAS